MKTNNPIVELMRKLGSPMTLDEFFITYYLPDVVPDVIPDEIREEGVEALGLRDTGNDEFDADRTRIGNPSAGPTNRAEPRPIRPVVRPLAESGRRG